MSDIKWIKITTTMFDDEKIKFIESMPEADAVIVIWVKLLTLAGKLNNNGYLLLLNNLPYTDEMLANEFKRPLTTTRMAIQILTKLDMVSFENNAFFINNWAKHQNTNSFERIKEQDRIRKANQRQREQQLLLLQTNSTDVLKESTKENTNNKDIEIRIENREQNTGQVTSTSREMSRDINSNHTTNNLIKPEKMTFEEYKITLKSSYSDLDYDAQYEKFVLYWSEGGKQLKRPKSAWRNWLDRAREYKQQNRNNGKKPIGGQNVPENTNVKWTG